MLIKENNNKIENIYISSCAEDGGIYQFKIKSDNTLEQASFTALDRSMYTIINNNRLYAILRAPFNNSSNSGITSFVINKDGALSSQSETVSTMGDVACHLCVDNNNIYAVNYISGSICLLPDKLVTHKGSSIHETRQDASHMHFVTVSPDGKYIIATDLGADKIYIYDKALNYINSASATLGSGPRHLATSADGDLIYCANELSSTVSVYKYNNGTLSLLGDYPALPSDFSGESTMAAIRRFGEYLYVSNRGHDSIVCFKINGDKLEYKSTTYCGGKSPRDFIIFDNTLICTNEDDGTVCVFEIINHVELNLKQKINIKNALCVSIY